MTFLYFGFFLLLCLALFIICMPFVLAEQRNVSALICTSSVFIGFVLILFVLTGGTHQLSDWLNGGREHYILMGQVQALGGIEGMIKQLEVRVKAHPEDATAKQMLLRLYKFKN